MGEPVIEELADLDEATEVLTAAFSTAPVPRRLFGDDLKALRALYTATVPLMLENPGSILLGLRDERGLASVAVCEGPGKETPLWRLVILGVPLTWRLGLRRMLFLKRFNRDLCAHSPLRPDQLHLYLIGTRPEAFGRGYGSALLERIHEHAISVNLSGVYLETARDGRSRRFYERHGYRVEKDFDCIAGPNIVMTKSLKASG